MAGWTAQAFLASLRQRPSPRPTEKWPPLGPPSTLRSPRNCLPWEPLELATADDRPTVAGASASAER
jgi:hypothetical protein